MYYTANKTNKQDETVREMQNKLNAIRTQFHHNWDYLTPDGYYGPKTAAAVRKFQEYRGIRPASGILGDTTARYIREEYNSIPQWRAAPSARLKPEAASRARRSDSVDKPRVIFDTTNLLANEGMPIYKALEEAFPIAFKRITSRGDSPRFVFSRNEAYHNKFGDRYKRVDVPDTVLKYLNTIGVIWSWITIWKAIEEYFADVKKNGVKGGKTLRMGADIYTLCTSSLDCILSSSKFKQLALRVSEKYMVAEAGAAVSLTGATALSTIGQCIGAFLLGWEIGKLIGDIPIGNGKCVQDVIDVQIEKIWEHPYKTLTPVNPIAHVIVALKNFINLRVNMVSNLKPLTPAEKRKLELWQSQHREMSIYAAPPRLIMTSAK